MRTRRRGRTGGGHGRLFKWLIPLALITFGLLWPVVFTRRRRQAIRRRRSGGVQQLQGATSSSTATASSTPWRRSPPSFPAAGTASSGTGTSPTRTTRGCGRQPEVTSILLDGEPVPYQMLWEGGERFRVAKIGDPDQYLSYGTHVFEIRYTHPRRPRPRRHRRGQDSSPQSTGDACRIAVGVLLERHRAVVEQPDPNGPTSPSRCPATSAARSARSATASARPAAT